MSSFDWVVLLSTLVLIVVYGMYKSRGNRDIEGYLLGNNSMPWYMVGLSIMATQASAITFLSAPGQAFTDGMRFVQFYFGLPLAMIVLCITVIPLFSRLRVFTAYEYLENRFDHKTRALGALLFLIQRGVSTGISIYAPAIILSALLGWNIYLTNFFIGTVVIVYTVSGGTRAVSFTHLAQMAVILSGMLLAGLILVNMLPEDIGFVEALQVAGKSGKMNVVDLSFDPDNRYNIWSGLIGGFFLALSYFGTDQSQVARYLSGKSVSQSRFGLILNGIVKIPMQFSILLIGAILYVFYLFQPQPVFFNGMELDRIQKSKYSREFSIVDSTYTLHHTKRKEATYELVKGIRTKNEELVTSASLALKHHESEGQKVREEAKSLIKKNHPAADLNDTNYIFLTFVIRYLPEGVIGLLIAVIIAASMSSTSSALNALASTSIIDIYKRSFKKHADASHYLGVSRIATVIWGTVAMLVAMFANKMGSLIEAVNILGSLFYGTILGIFVCGFYFKQLRGHAVFYAALLTETIIILCYIFTEISFLWYNLIGCILVTVIAYLLQYTIRPFSEGRK